MTSNKMKQIGLDDACTHSELGFRTRSLSLEYPNLKQSVVSMPEI